MRNRKSGRFVAHSEDPLTLARCRDLRLNATHTEQLLWSVLRMHRMGFKFRRQHPIGPFIVDFYCAAASLAIEIDGSVHDDPLRLEYDQRREAYLRSRGIEILRFTNEEVRAEPESVVEHISELVRARVK